MKPIIKIILVLVLSGVICHIVFVPIKKAYSKVHFNEMKRLGEILNAKDEHDMLFLGSSRSLRSINPLIVDSCCEVNSYNAGLDGARISEISMLLKGYLLNHPYPKEIVLTLDLATMMKTDGIYNYPLFYPFIANREVCKVMSENGYHVNLIKALPFLAITDIDDYNKENILSILITGKVKAQNSFEEVEYKGYVTNSYNTVHPNELKNMKMLSVDLYGKSVDLLQEIIDTCKNKNIKLIFTYAPEYDFYIQKVTKNKDQILNFIETTAQKNKITYLRNDSLDICKDPTLFADTKHLNTAGATIYSKIIGKQLKEVLSPVILDTTNR